MEVDEIHTQPCKLSRIGNGRSYSNKIGQKSGQQYQDEDEADGEGRGGRRGGGFEGSVGLLSSSPGSRIFRVSRASGGKDRHSKVVTAKGLRDRRVRLSVSTAIQFYDLQDRLGYDQPSKAVEWLIKAAADAIAELPSLNNAFPDTPKQPSDENRSSASQPRLDPAEVELEVDSSYQQQHVSLTKSTCSSTSETSRGSVISLSRSESRVKARERARERVKEKEKEDTHATARQQNLNPNSQCSSFTELLNSDNGNCPSESAQPNPGACNFVLKTTRNSPSMDYFCGGVFGRTHHSHGFSGQAQFGNSPPGLSMTMLPPFSVMGDHHQELQQYSFLPDHLIPVSTAAAAGSDQNLNFNISSGLGGINRGTLQSNSSSSLPHLQRFSSPVDGPNVPFFIGTAASAAVTAPVPVEHHHQFPAGFDGRLQLYYGDVKGKGKN